ncbi:hemagglutinin repeat-containing protein, partial [Rodentibacter trehalosifermentans]|uniref:hemagglutinin repeat-containing protein n=1 Tax=Rodentibacter trehalosifermentans TaxID=1908263 RepID=UPI001A96C1B5
MMHSIKRSGEVKNDKLKQLHQIKAAYESLELVGGIADTVDTLSNLGKMTEGDVSNPTIKLSVSIGASQSKQTTETKTVTHSGSELSAGTVAITSRQGDVDILGSTIHAKRAEWDVTKNLNVESVQDTYHNRSENKNSGWRVGAFLGANGSSYGLGAESSAQSGKGHENSDSITQRNSYINAEETLIKTGQDAHFKGAKLNSKRLEADIQGNLTLESLQDSNHYDSKQVQTGAGFSVAVYGSNASANYAKNKAKVNYAQVEEQTGFHVGEGGMNVSVGGNTDLKGAIIESDAEASKNHFKTTSLTHSDIENRSEVEVKSISAGISTDMAQNAKNAMAATASLLGNKHETQSSQTKSAIGGNINIETEKTPENLTALSRDTKNAN